MDPAVVASLVGGVSGGVVGGIVSLIGNFLMSRTLSAGDVGKMDRISNLESELSDFRKLWEAELERTKKETSIGKKRDVELHIRVVELQLERLLPELVWLKREIEDFKTGASGDLSEIRLPRLNFLNDPRFEHFSERASALIMDVAQKYPELQEDISAWNAKERPSTSDPLLDQVETEVDDLSADIVDLQKELLSQKSEQ